MTAHNDGCYQGKTEFELKSWVKVLLKKFDYFRSVTKHLDLRHSSHCSFDASIA